MLLKMLVSLAGPEFTLSPGDEREFEGELVEGEVTGEAGRLVAAGFAVPAEDDTEEDGESELKATSRKRKKVN